MRPTAHLLLLLYEVLLCLDVSHQASGPCARALGLATGTILDWQLSASSTLDRDPDCHVKFARLHQPRSRAWCARSKSASEWLMVDLGVVAQVTSVMTQGRADREEWVSAYALYTSKDGVRWSAVPDVYGSRKVFLGNSDSHAVRLNYLDTPVLTRFVRLHVLEWNRHPSLRLEIVGCQECHELLSEQPLARVTASSHQGPRRGTCDPEDAHLASQRGWCSRYTDQHQWLQLDLGPPVTITAVLTKGRSDSKRRHWVTSYSLSYSNDSVVWFAYKDDNELEPRVFGGNSDRSTERRHYLQHPFTSRFVRLHPLTWHDAIALRAGVLGCRHTGTCGAGFMQVNSLSHCVPNLAAGRPTWVNDRRHGWADWQHGHSALAADGIEDTVLPRCAILDNYYVDQPVWMVDLGWREPVSGIMVVTWQGAGQDKMTTYRDYVYNLDRLSVHVSNRARLEPYQLSENSTSCGVASRAHGAVFRPRLHFTCPDRLRGRYVYVTAAGVATRWSQLFSAVLCEVMVYS